MWFDSVVYDDDHDFYDYDLVIVWMYLFWYVFIEEIYD